MPFLSTEIARNRSVLRTVVRVRIREGFTMDPQNNGKSVDGRPQFPSDSRRGHSSAMSEAALLALLLAGCQSSQDIYLAQATGHATARDVEQAFGPPMSDQALETGQRRWLYRRDGEGTGGRDFTPYCQDLWLTFDREGILRTWLKQRC